MGEDSSRLSRDQSIDAEWSRQGDKEMKTFCRCFVAMLMVLSYVGTLGADAIKLKWGATRNQSGCYEGTVFIKKVVNEAYPNKIVVTVVKTKRSHYILDIGWEDKSIKGIHSIFGN